MNREKLSTPGPEPCGQKPEGSDVPLCGVKFLRSDVLLHSVMYFDLQNVNGRSAPIIYYVGADFIRPQQGYGSHNIIGASATRTYSLLLLTYNLKRLAEMQAFFLSL